MVGVPVFFRCDCGPSSRTTWPNFRICRRRMISGPNRKQKISDVRMPRIERNVR